MTLIPAIIGLVMGAASIALMRYSFRSQSRGRLWLTVGFFGGMVAWTALVAITLSLMPLLIIPALVFYVAIFCQCLAVSRLLWFRSLAAALRAQAPLANVLQASLYRINPFDRRHVQRAYNLLQAGASPEKVVGELKLPYGYRMAIALQQRSTTVGQENRATRMLEREEALLRGRMRRGGHWLYVALPAAALGIVGSALALFVSDIFDEFSYELPMGIDTSSSIHAFYLSLTADRLTSALLPLCLVFAAFASLVGLLQFTGAAPFFPWGAPKKIWSMRLLPLLADAIDEQAPLNDAIAKVSAWGVSAGAARLIRTITEAELRGIPWYDALTHRRYLTGPQRELLVAAARAGDLPWAIDTVCDRLLDDWSRRQARSNSILFPSLLITIGILAAQYPITLFVWLSYAIVNS